MLTKANKKKLSSFRDRASHILRLGLSSFEEFNAYKANEASVSGETYTASVSRESLLDLLLNSISITESALNEFFALSPGESFDFPSPSRLL
jgi:hypothetical protein